MSTIDLRLVPVSGHSTDPAGHALFNAWAGVFAASAWHDVQEEQRTADELRVDASDPTRERVQVLAFDGETAGGALDLTLPLRDNRHLAYGEVAVHPDHRRRGIGATLLAAAEAAARGQGRTTLIAETMWLGDDHRVGDSGGAFARRFGYAPAQTMLRSDYSVDDQAPDGGPTLPAGYAVQTHTGTPPAADRSDRAWLARRMSTDAPLGDLALEEEEWDEERVAALDARLEEMGRGRTSAFARHLDSGRLVAFTEIQVPTKGPTLAYQQDTLVLREHRGHGLGLALKRANVALLRTAYPAVLTVRTWNAVENAHMLAVNAQMGFRPTGFVREWQKVL